eukprot:4950263-Heterocapsa_arctica.AAC.1
MGVGGLSWMMLQQLSFPRNVWPICSFASGGQLPTTNEGSQELVTQIKTQCHLIEATRSGH